jgi:hypothetical protein
MMAWKMIKVRQETYERIFELCNRWNLSASQVIERLLQLYDAYLESDNAAQSVVNALETLATEPARSSPPLVEPEPAMASTNDELRQVVADMLYVTEAVVDMLGTIISVYPDLRAECAPIFDRLTRRFDEVAAAWNLVPASEATEQPPEQPSEQPAAAPGGAPGAPGEPGGGE